MCFYKKIIRCQKNVKQKNKKTRKNTEKHRKTQKNKKQFEGKLIRNWVVYRNHHYLSILFYMILRIKMLLVFNSNRFTYVFLGFEICQKYNCSQS
jgi:hypothetical protein